MRIRIGLVTTTTLVTLALSTTVASAAPLQPSGNAPQCVQTVAWDEAPWNYQTATNHCDGPHRIKLVWAVASSHCVTLDPGQSYGRGVLRPAWPDGADLCRPTTDEETP
jgi:hypothetical protein